MIWARRCCCYVLSLKKKSCSEWTVRKPRRQEQCKYAQLLLCRANKPRFSGSHCSGHAYNMVQYSTVPYSTIQLRSTGTLFLHRMQESEGKKQQLFTTLTHTHTHTHTYTHTHTHTHTHTRTHTHIMRYLVETHHSHIHI